MKESAPEALLTQNFWKALLYVLSGIVIGGVLLMTALLLGAADPPTDHLIDLERYTSGVAAPPFTIVTRANGFLLTCSDGTALTFQVRRDGYFSVSTAETLDWQAFPHIGRENNRLYFHLDVSGSAAFRINQEVAWSGRVSAESCRYERMSQ